MLRQDVLRTSTPRNNLHSATETSIFMARTAAAATSPRAALCSSVPGQNDSKDALANGPGLLEGFGQHMYKLNITLCEDVCSCRGTESEQIRGRTISKRQVTWGKC